MIAGIFTGCGKSDPPSPNDRSNPQSAIGNQQSAILKFHWLGKRRLATESNAINFMAIWNLPESARLEAQTLDKLSTAPWRLLKNVAPLSNAPTALLRPLLDDLVREESYLEVRGDTNQPTELVLAVRLPADRAALWQTNLPAILRSLSARGESDATLAQRKGEVLGVRDSSSDFNFQLSVAPKQSGGGSTNNYQVSLRLSGDWTLLSVMDSRLSTLNPQPLQLLADFQQRLAATQIPYAPRTTNHWVETVVDAQQINHAFGLGWNLPSNLPRLFLHILGDGSNVRTSGELTFSQPLGLNLESWSIPTNLICDPLVSFTAMRGTAPWLGSWKGWRKENFGPPPNQVFFWAQSPALWSHFLTYPVANASNHVAALGDWVMREWNPIFQTNRVGKFDWATNKFGLVWMGVPFFKPVVEPARFAVSDYALIGLFANHATNRPVPAGLFAEFQNRTNLIYYDWELTPPQVTSWTQMGQLLRMIFGRRQLSPATASLPWLRAVSPHLGNSTTVITIEAPDRLGFKRTSVLGLTSVELHLLADWLESPEFPHGSHTLLLSRPPVPASAITNVLPAAAPGK